MDILALALACDLTRVASMQFSTSTSQVTHKWLGTTQAPQSDNHHNYSHNGPTYALRARALRRATTTWASAPVIA